MNNSNNNVMKILTKSNENIQMTELYPKQWILNYFVTACIRKENTEINGFIFYWKKLKRINEMQNWKNKTESDINEIEKREAAK